MSLLIFMLWLCMFMFLFKIIYLMFLFLLFKMFLKYLFLFLLFKMFYLILLFLLMQVRQYTLGDKIPFSEADKDMGELTRQSCHESRERSRVVVFLSCSFHESRERSRVVLHHGCLVCFASRVFCLFCITHL